MPCSFYNKKLRDNNLKNAGLKILESGVEFVVIKKGEHGALIFNKDIMVENFISPNKLRFPISRNLLEKYYK